MLELGIDVACRRVAAVVERLEPVVVAPQGGDDRDQHDRSDDDQQDRADAKLEPIEIDQLANSHVTHRTAPLYARVPLATPS